MDRHALQESFEIGDVPCWTCPTCARGRLRLVGEFTLRVDAATKREHNEDYWEPEWSNYVFNGLLECGECHESVMVTGTAGVEPNYRDMDEGTGYRYSQYLTPRYFTPPLKIISPELNDQVPSEVFALLNKAFEIFWCDPDSCLNRLRSVAEQILTYHNVPTLDSKRKHIPLGRRIQMFDKSEYAEVKDALTAARHIGNEGSHGFSGVKRDELLDSFAVIEYCLLQFFPIQRDHSKVKKFIADVIKNEGLRPKPSVED